MDNPLGPARGCCIGVLLGAAIWTGMLTLLLVGCTSAPPPPRPTDVVAATSAADILETRLDRLQASLSDVGERLESDLRIAREQRAILLSQTRRVEDLVPPEYRVMTVAAAERHGVTPRLLAALATVESGWDPQAVGTAGEVGLTQIMPATALWIAQVRGRPVPDLTDPFEGLDWGAWYLAILLEETHGDEAEALARYNAGPRWRERAPVAARGYSRRVLARVGDG